MPERSSRYAPLTVAALALVTINHARLAYLSACSTAHITDPSLLDEAAHLATAFQLAGFPTSSAEVGDQRRYRRKDR